MLAILTLCATGAAGAHGNAASSAPSISADGGRAAFRSTSTNLDPADTDAVVGRPDRHRPGKALDQALMR
jgi:hypothetical protein